MYKGVNIAALGGDSPARIAKHIAEALFTPTELSSLVIDPKKTLTKDRMAADDERTELYKQAVQIALGTQYTKDLYKKTLSLVNQKCLDLQKKAKATSKENGVPLPLATKIDVLCSIAYGLRIVLGRFAKLMN